MQYCMQFACQVQQICSQMTHAAAVVAAFPWRHPRAEVKSNLLHDLVRNFNERTTAEAREER